jgi:FAD/FMN-containing dehydrogenase
MPRSYSERLAVVRPDLGLPFATVPEVTILIEAATTVAEEALPGEDGAVPLVERLQAVLGAMLEEGLIEDAIVATSEAQRRVMWARREAAAEICVGLSPVVDTDVCVPVDRVAEFMERAEARMAALDPGCRSLTVAHLGDGNLHYSVFPTREDEGLKDAVMEAVEDVVQDLGGSFSAEHGIGLSKLPSMRRRKDPVALEVMRAVKAALDPGGVMNPGKVVP